MKRQWGSRETTGHNQQGNTLTGKEKREGCPIPTRIGGTNELKERERERGGEETLKSASKGVVLGRVMSGNKDHE